MENKGLLIHNGRILLNEGFSTETILIKDGKITALGEDIKECYSFERIDAKGNIVSPGFIDLHVHGGAGIDFSNIAPKSLESATLFHASHGTTGLLATTVSEERISLKKIVGFLSRKINTENEGAAILGINLEGPFINREKSGAHNFEKCRKPDLDELKELLIAGQGKIKLVTIAPELDNAHNLIDFLKFQGIKVAIGHSDAAYAETAAAIKKGITHCTHCFNAMRQFHHRDPGGVAAVLLDDRVCVEVICDGFHISPEVVRMVTKLKPLEKMILITDCTAPAGSKEGGYFLGGQKLCVEKGAVTTPTGNLAGSTLTMDTAVKNMLKFSNLSLEQALKMATINPAGVIGMEANKGSIEIGKDADLVILDKKNLSVLKTFIKGKMVYPNSFLQ